MREGIFSFANESTYAYTHFMWCVTKSNNSIYRSVNLLDFRLCLKSCRRFVYFEFITFTSKKTQPTVRLSIIEKCPVSKLLFQ